MADLIPEDKWPAINAAIVANQKLRAIKEIRALAGCGLSDALGILHERYTKLRTEFPERFDCSDREYWEGFYS